MCELSVGEEGRGRRMGWEGGPEFGRHDWTALMNLADQMRGAGPNKIELVCTVESETQLTIHGATLAVR